MAEELDLHLLEFPAAERVIPRIDLVAERLSDLRDPERQLEPRAVENVAEIDEDPLRGFGAEVGDVRSILNGANVGLEHEIELPRLRNRANLVTLRAFNFAAFFL